jgi:hypothetical protein
MQRCALDEGGHHASFHRVNTERQRQRTDSDPKEARSNSPSGEEYRSGGLLAARVLQWSWHMASSAFFP